VGAVRLSVAFGPVRELVDAVFDHPDRAHVRALGHDRRLADRPGQQHIYEDRPGRAGGACREERDSDRRGREAEAERGPGPLRRPQYRRTRARRIPSKPTEKSKRVSLRWAANVAGRAEEQTHSW